MFYGNQKGCLIEYSRDVLKVGMLKSQALNLVRSAQTDIKLYLYNL